MGADHSMHLDRCSRGFQNEYREIMVLWGKAQRDMRQIRDPDLKDEAGQINQSIKMTLKDCWLQSRENYPMFERLVRDVEDNIVEDINTMEELCQLGRGHHTSDYGRGGNGAPGSGGGRNSRQGDGGYGQRAPASSGGRNSRGGGGRGGGSGGHQFGSLSGSRNSMYRDEYMERDSYDVNPHQHHAATVHGVMHCKGGIPLQKGSMYKIDFGEMRGHVGQLVDIQHIGRNETRVNLVGRDRYGDEWEEEFDEMRNEYGKIVFPIHLDRGRGAR